MRNLIPPALHWPDWLIRDLDGPAWFDVSEARIATIVMAFGLAMVAIHRARWHKEKRQHDLTAAYTATAVAMIIYVIASGWLSWARFGLEISTIREAMFIVYNLMTMVAWCLWFLALRKRGVNGARPEGR